MLRIIDTLSDGHFHSGEELGEKLKLSRAAIWKLVKQLSDWHIDVESRTGKGYRIKDALSLLKKESIEQYIEPSQLQKINNIEIFPSISSTNEYLLNKKLDANTNYLSNICLAERQTHGRGRCARSWYSIYGKNIALSLLWHFPKDISELSGLSLAVATSVLKVLHDFNIKSDKQDLGLKWPNDIIYQYKKLGGLLIELIAEPHDRCRTVIGIGLNVAPLPDSIAKNIQQPWTDIQTITGQKLNRNALSGTLINELIKAISIFQEKGLSAFIEDWRRYDLSFNQPVSILLQNTTIQGIGRGINENGAFILETTAGEIKHFTSGEVSLRIAT